MKLCLKGIFKLGYFWVKKFPDWRHTYRVWVKEAFGWQSTKAWHLIAGYFQPLKGAAGCSDATHCFREGRSSEHEGKNTTEGCWGPSAACLLLQGLFPLRWLPCFSWETSHTGGDLSLFSIPGHSPWEKERFSFNWWLQKLEALCPWKCLGSGGRAGHFWGMPSRGAQAGWEDGQSDILASFQQLSRLVLLCRLPACLFCFLS